jgi:hypothetical protein
MGRDAMRLSGVFAAGKRASPVAKWEESHVPRALARPGAFSTVDGARAMLCDMRDRLAQTIEGIAR